MPHDDPPVDDENLDGFDPEDIPSFEEDPAGEGGDIENRDDAAELSVNDDNFVDQPQEKADFSDIDAGEELGEPPPFEESEKVEPEEPLVPEGPDAPVFGDPTETAGIEISDAKKFGDPPPLEIEGFRMGGASIDGVESSPIGGEGGDSPSGQPSQSTVELTTAMGQLVAAMGQSAAQWMAAAADISDLADAVRDLTDSMDEQADA